MEKKTDKRESAPVWQQEELKIISQCPLCKFELDKEAVRLIEKKAETRLVHMTCPKCLNAVMAMVMVSEIGTGTIGTLTDLSADEVLKMRGKGKISEEDLLAFYSFIEKQKDGRQLSERLI